MIVIRNPEAKGRIKQSPSLTLYAPMALGVLYNIKYKLYALLTRLGFKNLFKVKKKIYKIFVKINSHAQSERVYDYSGSLIIIIKKGNLKQKKI